MVNDYKKAYENLLKEHNRLKEVFESNKEILVTNLHKLIGLKEDSERGHYLTYGRFFWKLTKDELLYLRECIQKNEKRS